MIEINNKSLVEQIELLATKIRQKTNSGLPRWMYYDPFKEKLVARRMLLTEGKFFEEVKPGLYAVCEDVYLNANANAHDGNSS